MRERWREGADAGASFRSRDFSRQLKVVASNTPALSRNPAGHLQPMTAMLVAPMKG